MPSFTNRLNLGIILGDKNLYLLVVLSLYSIFLGDTLAEIYKSRPVPFTLYKGHLTNADFNLFLSLYII